MTPKLIKGPFTLNPTHMETLSTTVGKYRKLSGRLGVSILVGVLFFISIFTVSSYFNHVNLAEEKVLDKLHGIAQTLALQIDGDKHKSLTDQLTAKDAIANNSQNTIYAELYALLKTAQESNNIETPVYTLIKETNDGNEKEGIYMGVTSSLPFFRHSYDSHPEVLLKNFQKGGVIHKYEDEHGIWLSAFAPVMTSNNEVACVVQIDERFDSFIAEARAEMIQRFLIWFFVLLIGAVFVISFSKNVVLSMDGINKTMEVMVEERTEALKNLNQNLEKLVDLRTRELRDANEQLSKTLSRLKSTQQQLITREKLASLGELTASIAHEIQNPLNFVHNFSDLSVELVEELKDSIEKTKEPAGNVSGQPAQSDLANEINEIMGDLESNIVKINNHGKRADKIIKEMLTHARNFTASSDSLVEVNVLLENRMKGAFESWRLEHGDLEVDIIKQYDKTRKREVPQEAGKAILNIFKNAIYAVSDKQNSGMFTDFKPTITISSELTDNTTIITIHDNGMGIPDEVKSKIFDPFFTTKPTGKGNTGLGLSLAHDVIVRILQGEINIESKEGVFTEVKIVLPVELEEV